MKDNEKILDYISRVILINNEMESCRETLLEQVIIENLLRYLTPQFDYIVVVIEHSKYLGTMRIEELQSSLEKFGHFAADCWSNKGRKSEKANIARGDYDDEPVLLMASEFDGAYLVYWWYMDTGCSDHLIRNKQWLVDFDFRKKTTIRCPDDKYLKAKGMGNVKVKVKNGKTVMIKDVWYVPGMKSNLMSGSNITLKVNMEIAETKCLSAEGAKGDSELWRKRLRHLNFIFLGHLNSKKWVYGIPNIVNPEKSYGICMKGK
ncbi:uncharacterized protein LOC127115202 [Lathyrus oleraceus]|uniref:uncharacterized protein LOC127115202 n=1 Tax=Pisum sativum TaxID=3888 RepID=UPI0021D2041A|nr:uncharacterized protein LOC127115202 [Pisum sativum]